MQLADRAASYTVQPIDRAISAQLQVELAKIGHGQLRQKTTCGRCQAMGGKQQSVNHRSKAGAGDRACRQRESHASKRGGGRLNVR
jgi:hypothetical protein